jgi:nicotinamide-nucleotide amidase
VSTNAILCITGSELTRGETRDLNGSTLAIELTSLGVRVEEIVLVPDDPKLLSDTVRNALSRAAIIIVSGGLGPTRDDCTVAVLSDIFGRAVYRHPEAMERMRARAAARGVSEDQLPANYWKQSEVLEGAEVLLNPVGLAPGMALPTDRGMLAVVPGVPREMQAVFRKGVLPAILKRFSMSPPRIFRGKILGIGESWAEHRIHDLGLDFDRVDYGISAKPGELLVKFVSHRPEDHPYLDTVRNLLESEFGDDFLPLEEGLLDASGHPRDVGHSRLVHDLLLESRTTVATAESCTGGLIAKWLTDHAGSSRHFLGSIVAYDNRIKETFLGVPREVLETHGAVSEKVCGLLAQNARERFGADWALATTGIAGPSGGSPEKPVGLVYVGLAGGLPQTPPRLQVERHVFWGGRDSIRSLASVRALDMLRRRLRAR